MSIAPRLRLPEGIRPVELRTPRGPLAALEAAPGTAAGSSVLLVPGYTGSKEDFLGVLEPIARAGYRTVAIDQRGQASSPHASRPEDYDLAMLAQDVLAVAAQLPGPVHLVGHSFGGLVARAAVLADPVAVRSLTMLCSGPSALPSPRADSLRTLLAALPVQDLPSIWVVKRALELEAGAVEGPPAVEAFLRARFLNTCPTGLLRMGERLLTEPDRTEELAHVDRLLGAVHVVYGQYDDAWPPAAQADMARRLGARETVLPGRGHSPAAEDPIATAAVLVAFFDDVDDDNADGDADDDGDDVHDDVYVAADAADLDSEAAATPSRARSAW